MKSVKHHFVPKVYLKNFSSPEVEPRHSFWEIDLHTGVATPSTPKRSGYLPHFHTIELQNGMKDQDSLEKTFGLLENQWNGLIEQITQPPEKRPTDLSRSKWSTFYKFAGLQHARVPKRVEHMERCQTELLGRIFRIAKHSPEFAKMCADSGMDVEKAKVLNISASHELSLLLSLESSRTASKLFAQMKWSFLVSDAAFFCTSDNPIYHDAAPSADTRQLPVGLGDKDVEVFFPLTRHICAYGRWSSEKHSLYVPISRIDVGRINHNTFLKAHRFIYSPLEPDKLQGAHVTLGELLRAASSTT